MHIGRLLCGFPDPATVVFTEWTPRLADNAVFTVELIHAVDAEMTVKVFHKNAEETGPGTLKGTLLSATGTPVMHSATFTGLKELVRFQIEAAGADTNDLKGLHYRFLPATWFNTARVSSPP